MRSGGEGLMSSNYFCIILNLPTDLIYKIFCRLQVKFISRCRVVCKAWYNLLSIPGFVNYYAKNTPFTTLVLSHYQQAAAITERDIFSFLEISEDGDDCTRTTINAKLPFWPQRNSALSLEDSCNGLLCFLLYNHKVDCHVIYIYNPTSGKSISLPEHRFRQHPIIFKHPYEEYSLAYLFGFSPSTNNFKVLKSVHIFDKRNKKDRVVRSEIFTVGVDHEWRQLKYAFYVRCPVCSLDLNVAACWFIGNTSIVAFDFGEEKLGHIPPPRGVVVNYRNMMLVALNRRLCLFDYSVPSHYTIWTMEEYGVVESWTKTVISRSCFSSDAPVLHHPIAMLRNGNILFKLVGTKVLVIYSPKRKECTVVEVLNDVEGLIGCIMEFE
ncbi:hypothetical protein BUALT_Bualt02G0230100 [Buddleja alternifolia]|uniref:F-box domain-containing protein n=1 Tax=Buddleja alternifolia TaxID=168488 RepID=A0AAV6Y3P7_9LAMI|nr:hypothetical protein BUALT_Bualt02G0230100 [Buddleja alternifolia]